KVEVKNLNSFRAVEKAIDFEIQRQKKALEQGEKVVQETRGWDDEKGITYSQRWKEEAEDYRYFPEPDLPLLHIYSKTKPGEGEGFSLEKLRKQIPEMPWQKQERIEKLYGFSQHETALFIQDEKLSCFFEKVIEELNKTKLRDKSKAINLAKNYLTSDLKGLMELEAISWDDVKISPQSFSHIITLLMEEKISSRVAKDILREVAKNGGEPEGIIKAKGVEQIKSADGLEMIATEIIKNNSTAVEDYKKGKTNVIQFLVGQAMAKTKGAGDPVMLERLFKEKLR
ncbi:MAG: Asp-tRNA(Asn)/Glu-tRNA(Gln) amidotransferase subunit GatB, partial [Candidatus Pacebacteria bacterium]|nr:Asp-tRNA(Asn)/Glu-tRNA(Gln) amidotransferase subunit GatB [Candidatus Paceibacterota bacterium]